LRNYQRLLARQCGQSRKGAGKVSKSVPEKMQQERQQNTMTEQAIRAVGAEIAKAIAPVFAEGRRALLRELEQIKAQPTGMNRREVVQFLQARGYRIPQWVTNLSYIPKLQ